MRLAGPRVALVPVPHAVALAVVAGDDPSPVLAAAAGLSRYDGWPHDDSAVALRPLAEHGAEGDVGTWLVAMDGQVIGECGWLGHHDADGDVELGYGLAAPARRQGLGTEAVGILAAWTEQQPGVRLLSARVLPGNEASLRLLSRLGFHEHASEPPYLRLVRMAPGTPRPKGKHVC